MTDLTGFRDLVTAGSICTGLLILIFTIRKPGRLKFFFLCFYFLSILGLSGQFLSHLLIRNFNSVSIGFLWNVLLGISRAAYIFLLLFLFKLNPGRVLAVVTVVLSLLICVSIVIGTLFYTIIPQLAESIILLYTIFILLYLKIKREKLQLGFQAGKLADILFYCTGFFGTGLVLDVLENIPYTRPWFSLLAVDFHPLFILCTGLLFLYWLLRFSSSEDMPEFSEFSIKLDALPVTMREREIVAHILQGKTNADIADELYISESTVKKHINSIFRKLSVSSRWELLKITGNSPEILKQ